MSFINFSIIDAIDILVVAFLIWQIYKAIRGTAAMTIFIGIFTVYLISIVVRILNMELLGRLIGQVIGLGSVALLIVFQQEVRRYLLMIGNRYALTRKGFFRRLFSKNQQSLDYQYFEEIIAACNALASVKMGALIVIQRTGDLEQYAETGDIVNGEVSKRLIETIFFKNSPLHDGAMLIRNERVWAARCTLPISDNPNIPAHLGMRHRAAIGLTEHSDAQVIVVSEETGKISLVESGNIESIENDQEIMDRLTTQKY